MSSASRLFCWLGLFLRVAIVAAESVPEQEELPRLLEVDVIFPRNDTYRPVFPFPVVVAIRGLPAAYRHGLDVQLFMGPRDIPTYVLGGLDYYTPGDLGKATDTFYIVRPDIRIINSTTPGWQLEYLVLLNPNCTVTREDRDRRNNETEISRTIEFTIDEKAGKFPDIVPLDGSCPQPIASFNMTGQHGYIPFPGDDCFVYVDYPADPCAVKATSSVESMVGTMMNRLLCKGHKWPQDAQKVACPYSAAVSTWRIPYPALLAGLLMWATIMMGF
ncbi:hypothetical protein VTK73DRAFT_4513 [Phialemonium thermophilum]|uniref:DUF7136 domain-containing protein n=1 Tax=Phialemonium thermophilum TaxID=223376 RepID=A0ABR3WT01_9PEZI